MHILHHPENFPASSRTLTIPLWSYRVPLYSLDPLESLPIARPLAYISMTTEISHTSEFNKLSSSPRPCVTDISMITGHPSHERVHQALTHRPFSHRSILSCFFSVRQSLVAIVGPRTGAREGTIQRPARAGRSHRPSAFHFRRARDRSVRQCPPPGAGRYPRSQHGPHPCTGIQEVGSGVRFLSPPPPLRGLH